MSNWKATPCEASQSSRSMVIHASCLVWPKTRRQGGIVGRFSRGMDALVECFPLDKVTVTLHPAALVVYLRCRR